MAIAWISAAVLGVPALLCLVCALYLVALLLAAVAGGGRRAPLMQGEPELKIAVAIPAHNEEKVLARTIESIQACEYPTELREIVVIADNCTDGTADVARTHSAVAIERHNDSARGKGYALEFFITQYIRDSDADAVAIVDADTVVSRNFLSVVGGALQRGVEAGQVRDTVDNAVAGWRPAMQYVSLALKNHARALGRRALGCSAGLFGNGMFFARSLLLRTGWPATSIVEDLEFGFRLMSEGIKVDYVPEAAVFALMPTSDEATETQKARWEFGQLAMARALAPRLARAVLHQRSLAALLWLLDLLTPPLVPLFGLAIMLLVVSAAVWGLSTEPAAMVPLALSFAATILLGVYAVGGLLLSQSPWHVWRSLLALPLYAFLKVRLYVRSVFEGGPKQWVRTGR